MPRRGHRLVERGEVTHPEHPVGRQRLKIELDLGEEPEGALGPDQEVGHVVAAAAIGRRQGVDVVAADPPEKGRKAARDLVRFTVAERPHAADEVGVVVVAGEPREVARDLAEPRRVPVRENRAHRVHVVHHVAVADGARAARVVAGHAPDGGPVGGRHVDGKEEPGGLQPSVEAVEHDSRLHRDPARLFVHAEHLVEVPAGIDDHRLADGLPALGGAGAARQDRGARLPADRDGALDVLGVTWRDHPDRLDLVDRRVGAVAAPARGVEPHLALELSLQARGESRVPRTKVRAMPHERCLMPRAPPSLNRASGRAAKSRSPGRRWRPA